MLESFFFFEEWKYKGIWAIANFLDDKGIVLLQREFCEKFQLQCTVNIYNRMINVRIRDLVLLVLSLPLFLCFLLWLFSCSCLFI